MPVPLVGGQQGADTQRLMRGEAAASLHDTLPQDVKSVRTLLQKKQLLTCVTSAIILE